MSHLLESISSMPSYSIKMPEPTKEMTKDEYIQKFMSSEEAKKSFSDSKQRYSVALSKWKEYQKKKKRSVDFAECKKPIQLRQGDDGEYYLTGWIYTTHMDRAKEDGADNTMFSKDCMEQIAEAINIGGAGVDSLGARRTVSIMHDWIINREPDTEPIGMAVPPVEVRQTDDGHWGVWGDTHVNKKHPSFEDTKYRIEHGYYPGFSIEFQEGDSKLINIKGRIVKFIQNLKEFLGYGIVNARRIANPKATIEDFGYRLVEETLKNIEKITEVDKMSEEEVKKDDVVEQPVEESSEVIEEESKKEEVESVVEEEEKSESKEETRTVDKIDSEKIVAQLRESKEYKEALDNIKINTRVSKQKQEDRMESINFRMMKESLANQDLPKMRMAAREYANEHNIVEKALKNPQSYMSNGLCANSTLSVRSVGKGLNLIGDIQIRGTEDTGSNPESTYGQQGAEFADVYAAGLIDTFNNQRNYFGFLEKEDHVEGGEYVGWELITSQNKDANTVHVDFDDVTVSKSYMGIEKIRTPLKIARVGISVADTTLRYSARSLGDLFQKNLDTGMNYMMNDVDAKLFAETQDGAGNNPLGLEAVADTTGNTTMYGKTRSTSNRLTTGTLADTYVSQAGAITEAAIRNGITKIETRGSNLGRVAIVTSPKGKGYLFNLLDGNRRFNTTQAEFGFNQMTVASYDGMPIITDYNCNSTLATASSSSACLYFIDRDSAKIVVGMAPTVTNLAKVGAATEAYLEMDYAHVYKDPTRIHMLDNFTTG